MQALVYLHLERKIHRDVKAGNILVAGDGSVRYRKNCINMLFENKHISNNAFHFREGRGGGFFLEVEEPPPPSKAASCMYPADFLTLLEPSLVLYSKSYIKVETNLVLISIWNLV